MRNAKEEITLYFQHPYLQVVCAEVAYFEDNSSYILKEGYTPEELKTFLDSLDFGYDAGYGSQELFGTIWFSDGAWAERYEYDGSECWVIKEYPERPHYLKR